MKQILAILSLMFLCVGCAFAQIPPDAINHASNRHHSGYTNFKQKSSGGHYYGGQSQVSRKGSHYQSANGDKGYAGNISHKGRKR